MIQHTGAEKSTYIRGNGGGIDVSTVILLSTTYQLSGDHLTPLVTSLASTDYVAEFNVPASSADDAEHAASSHTTT